MVDREEIRILLVEGPRQPTSAEFLLQAIGYQVVVAPTVEDAMARLYGAAPHLVIADIKLADSGVHTLLNLIKNDPRRSEIPVVVVSPFTEKHEFEIARCVSEGADDILSAELLETIIASRVQAILEKKALRDNEKEYLKEIENQKEIVEERNRSLQEMNDLKNKFIGIAAHDLRNPLVSIRGFSEIMLEELAGIPDEEKIKLLRIIFETSDQMLSLVNDLLDVSVIESGKLDLELEEGSLNDLIDSRLAVLEPLAKKKQIELVRRFDVSGMCRFDPDRMAQVVDNLVSNAIKFSPLQTCVEVSLRDQGEGFKVSVRDEGPGITEEDREKLFQDFQKLGARPTGDETSTGLGLAIVKRIVEAHEGHLEVDSAPGEGATFSFTLRH